MTREQHTEEHERLYKIAMEHLDNAIENKDGCNRAEYQEYKSNMKQAKKHRGIASAMMTRSINKLAGYKVI